MDKIEGFLGKSVEGKKSRIPARLDFIQSASGLFLGLFMWLHMLFVSTILISEDAFNGVVNLFELRFISDSPLMSYCTFAVAVGVFVIFFVHAALGMRKMPINFRQWQIYRAHAKRMNHEDTTLWLIQACTGFVMFFLASAHLIIIATSPELSAEVSSNRMFTHFMWLFYLVLLFAVELHGGIGLYRLCVKWGWFEGEDYKATRKKLKKAKWVLSVFFIVLGLLSMATFIKYGYQNYTTSSYSTIIDNHEVNLGVKA